MVLVPDRSGQARVRVFLGPRGEGVGPQDDRHPVRIVPYFLFFYEGGEKLPPFFKKQETHSLNPISLFSKQPLQARRRETRGLLPLLRRHRRHEPDLLGRRQRLRARRQDAGEIKIPRAADPGHQHDRQRDRREPRAGLGRGRRGRKVPSEIHPRSVRPFVFAFAFRGGENGGLQRK